MPPSVVLWCPAYPLPPARQEPAVGAARGLVEAIGGNLTVSSDFPLWLGEGAWAPAAQRQVAFRQALAADLLLAARGGYGCLDLLPEVAAHRGPLPGLIGYSDLTVLHAAWKVRGGPETLYGFMPGVPHGQRALGSTLTLWRGEGQRWTRDLLPEVRGVRPGVAQGTLFAGCLRVLAGLVGTRWMPDLRGHLLAIEDIDERPYRIERDLQQLHLAGCLDGVVGLVTNAFPAATPAGYEGPSSSEIIVAWAARLGVPALAGLPFGHHDDPLTLPCGRMATLGVDTSGWHLDIAAR